MPSNDCLDHSAWRSLFDSFSLTAFPDLLRSPILPERSTCRPVPIQEELRYMPSSMTEFRQVGPQSNVSAPRCARSGPQRYRLRGTISSAVAICPLNLLLAVCEFCGSSNWRYTSYAAAQRATGLSSHVGAGLSQTEISVHVFSRNRTATRIKAALNALMNIQRVSYEQRTSAEGRTETRWSPIS